MELDEVLVKDCPGVCRCCLSEGCYKDLAVEYTWMGDNEIYADMLLECFDISVSQQMDGPNGQSRLICEVCITRLRDACNFKKQVVESEKKFIDMIGRGEFRKVIQHQATLKVEKLEPPLDDSEAAEVEYFDAGDLTDDEVLANLASTSRAEAPPVAKRGRGRPRKVKDPEPKVKKVSERGVKPKDEEPPAHLFDRCVARKRRQNLCVIFNNTTVIPFKWRSRYLCFYCGISCTEYSAFRKHTRAHGKCDPKDYSMQKLKGSFIEVKVDVSEIICEICSEPFGCLKEIVLHLKGKHGLPYDENVDTYITEYKLADQSCIVCEKQFSFFGHLVSHMNNDHPKHAFICNDCGLSFNKKRDLATHIRAYHKSSYTCEVCSKNFENQKQLTGHKFKHIVKCRYCNLSFSTSLLLKKHKEADHSDDSRKCVHCSKVCHSKIGLQLHLGKCKVAQAMKVEAVPDPDSHMRPPLKQNCKQIRDNILSVVNMTTATPFKYFCKFACFFCQIKFTDFESLKEHTRAEHLHCDAKCKPMRKIKGERICVKIDISNLACKICGIAIDDLTIMVDHLIKDHNSNYDKSFDHCLQPYRVSKDNIPCPHCPDLKFRYFSSLLKHINSEHSNNHIICSFCGQSFGRLSNLRAHVSNNHTRTSTCTICDTVFKNASALARHNAKQHDAKDYKCTLCKEEFSSPYKKQKHMIVVHNTGHKCNFCDRMFTRNSFKIDHMRRTHYKEKNVQCSVCLEKFFDNYLLRMHMSKHSGERNFHCDVCGKSFLRRSNLQGHKQVHKKQLLQGLRQDQ